MASTFHLLQHLALAVCLVFVASCGGGSGGSETPSPNPPAPEPEPEPLPEPEPEPEPESSASVAGLILTLPGAILDTDTNNPDNPQADNGSIGLAQTLTVPVTVGGYLEASSESTLADDEDWFQVSNAADYQVTLFIAEDDEADLDLTLYDEEGVVVDTAAGISSIEQLLIPDAGTYYIGASAYSGGSNYTMTIGKSNVSSSSPRPGKVLAHEVLVRYSAETVLNPDVSAENRRALTERFGLTELGGGIARLRRLRSMYGSADLFRLSNQRYISAFIDRFTPNSEALEQWQTWLRVKAIAKQPSVAEASPNFRVRTTRISDDNFSNFLWHYNQIGVPTAWATSTGNPSIVVAVIDTGIREHPDMIGQYVDGYDFIRDPESAGDGDGLDDDPTDGGAGSNTLKSGTFHGLHVAGTIAAIGNNNRGIAGIAYDSKVMPLRALDADGEGSSYDMIQALRYAAGLSNDSERLPSRTADVINLSLGAGSFSDSQQDIYDRLRDDGIIVVAASGNDGENLVDYPAAFANVFAVGATDAQNQRTSYSNGGTALDIVAPGGNLDADINNDGQPDGVLSTYYDEGPQYAFLEGTSMATPHVAGVFALMKSINPSLNYSDINALLAQGALTDDLGAEGRDDSYGWGQINAGKAVAAAINSIGGDIARPAQLGVSSEQLNFGTQLSALTVVLSNIGGGELTVLNAQSNVSWLNATASLEANGLGAWIIRVDRSALSQGRYDGVITFNSSAGAKRVSVTVQVATGTIGDLGTIYALLIDPESGETIAQAVASADNNYLFDFPDVAVGDYELWAGSDNDNDFEICDSGEACGAYITLDSPVVLNVSSDIFDVEFSSNYQLRLPSEASTSSTSNLPKSRSVKTIKRIQ